MTILKVNTESVVKYTNKLEKLHRSAFPVVVRQTLNSAAFDVKQKTMPISAKQFENRSSNFFKANSKVVMSKGFNIESMGSKVGFVSSKLKGSNNFAVKDLEQQEHGGRIKGKSFIPLDDARKGGSATPVRPSNRLSKIKNPVNQNRFRGTKKQQFIKAVHRAKKGGHVLGGSTKGETTLFKVTGLSKKTFKVKPLYSYKKNRSVKVKQTWFMRNASVKSSKKMDNFYITHAKKQFSKALR